MTEEIRKCTVYDTNKNLINEECTFIKFGNGTKYGEGDNLIQVDIALVERKSGEVIELAPTSITFIPNK